MIGRAIDRLSEPVPTWSAQLVSLALFAEYFVCLALYAELCIVEVCL